MNALATDWDPFGSVDVQPPEAIAADKVAEAEPKPEAVTEPVVPHTPLFDYTDMKPQYRTNAVPEALIPFMVESVAEGWTPPFWVNRSGSTRATIHAIPGCPPVKAGDKVLVFDDWGNPKVIEVTAMTTHGTEVRGMLGTTPVQCQAWIAMKPEAPLTVVTKPDAPARLTDEEAAALEAEIMEWSKFLGWRADKYSWCGTFENILRDMGVEPWRPGFKTVTLEVNVRLDTADLGKAVVEKIGGEAVIRSATIATQVVIKDVSRDDFENSRWTPLLEKAGYKNFSVNRVLAKEAMTQ